MHADLLEMAEIAGTMEPFLEGIVVDKMMRGVLTSLEASHRAGREDLKRFDEVMEQFRKHTYSLRRLILCGTLPQSIDMLQFYFQVHLCSQSAFLHMAFIVATTMTVVMTTVTV